MIHAVYHRFLPNKVLAWTSGASQAHAGPIPLLAAKKRIDGRATAYVCENFRCKAPVTSPEDLARQLDAK
jgi:uncharacterized protein YyaL (SSP411 family)